jgi:hypothetical protein
LREGDRVIRNIGATESHIRIAAGAVLLLLVWFALGPGGWRWVFTLVGLIALVTGGVSY